MRVRDTAALELRGCSFDDVAERFRPQYPWATRSLAPELLPPHLQKAQVQPAEAQLVGQSARPSATLQQQPQQQPLPRALVSRPTRFMDVRQQQQQQASLPAHQPQS